MRPTSDYVISYSGEGTADTIVLVALGACLALVGAVTVRTALSRTPVPSRPRFFVPLAAAAVLWVVAAGAAVMSVTADGADCGRVAHAISAHGVPGYGKEIADRSSRPCRDAARTRAIVIGVALAGSVACSLTALAASRPHRQRPRRVAERSPRPDHRASGTPEHQIIGS